MSPDRVASHPEAHVESELIQALEPDQLAATAALPLPRARVSRSTELLLAALRVMVLIVTGLVVYTFIVELARTP